MEALDGVQSHIDAIARGEAVESRLNLIRTSNSLDDDAKRKQGYFVKAFCLAAALDPLCGTRIDFGGGLELELNKPSWLLKDREKPGVRVDGDGWLVVEGEYYRDGRPCDRRNERGHPRWPLMWRIPADAKIVTGPGPWENFRGQAIELLRQAGERWPQSTLTG